MSRRIRCECSPTGWLDLYAVVGGRATVAVRGETVGFIQQAANQDGETWWRTFDVRGRETFLGAYGQEAAARGVVVLWNADRVRRPVR